MNVLSSRQIHHGVCAPLRSPAHLFHLFVNARCDRRVSDVRVDLYQEITANDHWLQFRMIHIRRNNRPAACHLFSYELRSDVLRNPLVPVSAYPGSTSPLLVAQVFPDRNIFHFWRDDALARIPELSYGMSSRGAESCALEAGKKLSAPSVANGALDMNFAQVPVVHRQC